MLDLAHEFVEVSCIGPLEFYSMKIGWWSPTFALVTTVNRKLGLDLQVLLLATDRGHLKGRGLMALRLLFGLGDIWVSLVRSSQGLGLYYAAPRGCQCN